MKKLLIILALFLMGCEFPDNKDPRQYKFNDMYRYENEEVICYIVNDYRPFGISCVWKQMLKNSGNFNVSVENVKGDNR